MKLRVTQNWNPLADSYQLTKQEIESQVMSDLGKYRQIYMDKYGKKIPNPFDVDNFVKEIWGFEICFQKVEQNSDEGQEILGYLKPDSREVIVDETCTNPRRISFTIAHEAGHLSLHGPLFSREDGLITGWAKIPASLNKKKLEAAHVRREWQANVYAGSLLAPESEVHELLRDLGLLVDSQILPFNLDDYDENFSQRFGLSRQALEIRLKHLNIPYKLARNTTNFKSPEKPPSNGSFSGLLNE